jgi:DNA-binding SARP family transcriptional activator
MATVNLALLGGIRLQTDPGKPVLLSTKKAAALLAYLALHPGRAQPRAKLAALLWGERSEMQARDSLRQALSLVRKALLQVDSRALITHEDTVSLEPTALTTGDTSSQACLAGGVECRGRRVLSWTNACGLCLVFWTARR